MSRHPACPCDIKPGEEAAGIVRAGEKCPSWDTLRLRSPSPLLRNWLSKKSVAFGN
jgi:hypothetical protein